MVLGASCDAPGIFLRGTFSVDGHEKAVAWATAFSGLQMERVEGIEPS